MNDLEHPAPGTNAHRTAPLNLAIIGAGPVGMALAVAAAQALPDAAVTLYDARPIDKDLSHDPRTLALSLGSVQILRRLGAWHPDQTQPILSVHVSQQQPSLAGLSAGRWADPQVSIHAKEEGVPQLGAVVHYGAVAAPLQNRWLSLAQAQPQRLHTCFGCSVQDVQTIADHVEVRVQTAGLATPDTRTYDGVVIAEGGVFAEQARKAIARPYGQRAWVGTVTLAQDHGGCAWERFTPTGPLALLPLPGQKASLVWCVTSDDDDVAQMTDGQRLAAIQAACHPSVGALTAISALKGFELGLNAETQLVQGRTVRIGNAAQTLHPVAGQGLNLGLRDAMGLVQALTKQGEHPTGDRWPQLLRQMPYTRHIDRWSLMGTTDFLARAFTWQLPGAALVRGLGLASLQHQPWLKSRLARHMMFGLR